MDLTSRTARVKEYLKNTAKKFKGAARRLFQAETVQVLGPGGQTWVERELGWCRSTVRKGLHELETGITCTEVGDGALAASMKVVIDENESEEDKKKRRKVF